MNSRISPKNGSEADWPEYPTPSKDIVFAIGMVALSYNSLESTLNLLFATVTGVPAHLQSVLFGRMTDDGRIDVLRAALDHNKWPDDITGLFEHFLSGYDICSANRNLLLHSIAGLGEEANDLTRFREDGMMEQLRGSLPHIRSAADEMTTFKTFGSTLLGRLMSNRTKEGRFDPKPRLAWPEKPPLPKAIRYTRVTT
jgi:hypothetical protein